jgi:hypothetical protein
MSNQTEASSLGSLITFVNNLCFCLNLVVMFCAFWIIILIYSKRLVILNCDAYIPFLEEHQLEEQPLYIWTPFSKQLNFQSGFFYFHKTSCL